MRPPSSSRTRASASNAVLPMSVSAFHRGQQVVSPLQVVRLAAGQERSMGSQRGGAYKAYSLSASAGEMLESPLPGPAFGRGSRSADLCPLTEPLRQHAPWHPGADDG